MKKTKLIILFVFLGLSLSSCKNYYLEPHNIEGTCKLDKTQFLNAMEPILLDEGFTVKVDEKRGYVIAEKVVEINSIKHQLNLSVNIDEEKDELYITPSSISLPRQESKVKYYSKKRMPKELIPHFSRAIDRMKTYCGGNNFPNKP
jgi:hypothetical protein